MPYPKIFQFSGYLDMSALDSLGLDCSLFIVGLIVGLGFDCSFFIVAIFSAGI